MDFFNITNIAFNILNYPVSYVELIGTLFGLISVYYASKANILTWSTGIINEVFLFILFFQVQLYADMFLQVYFLIVTIYGWYNWNVKVAGGVITTISKKSTIVISLITIVSTIILGLLFKNIHLYFPYFFKIPAAFPFIDSFVMVLSIIATVLLAQKKIENWYLWIVADLICVVLYFKKGVYFLSIEYLIFLLLAGYGFYYWQKQVKQ